MSTSRHYQEVKKKNRRHPLDAENRLHSSSSWLSHGSADPRRHFGPIPSITNHHPSTTWLSHRGNVVDPRHHFGQLPRNSRSTFDVYRRTARVPSGHRHAPMNADHANDLLARLNAMTGTLQLAGRQLRHPLRRTDAFRKSSSWRMPSNY